MARILIVDDDPETVALLAKAVRLLGHEPVTAYGCDEALARIGEDLPDLILLDLMMPEVDGYETMQRIRARPQSGALPIVVITASQEADILEKVARCGGNEVYRKPVSLDVLSDVIGAFVDSESPRRLEAVGRDPRWRQQR